ncbi:MAG: ABC transporter permease, partial [Pyrinomonadaceae bacterium]
VVFPIEVLPIKIVIASFIPEAVGLIVLIGYVLVQYGSLPPSYFLLPVVLVLQALAMLGVAMMFSAAGVFLRDLKDFVQLFAAAGIYLMPVVYLPQWVPGPFRPILYLNPFSYMAWCFQDVLYFGRIEHPWAWLLFGLGSLFVFVSGYRVFRNLKPQLGNVL